MLAGNELGRPRVERDAAALAARRTEPGALVRGCAWVAVAAHGLVDRRHLVRADGDPVHEVRRLARAAAKAVHERAVARAFAARRIERSRAAARRVAALSG